MRRPRADSFKRMLGATLALAPLLPFPALLLSKGRRSAFVTLSGLVALSFPSQRIVGTQPSNDSLGAQMRFNRAVEGVFAICAIPNFECKRSPEYSSAIHPANDWKKWMGISRVLPYASFVTAGICTGGDPDTSVELENG
jgi:hypothetical protein